MFNNLVKDKNIYIYIYIFICNLGKVYYAFLIFWGVNHQNVFFHKKSKLKSKTEQQYNKHTLLKKTNMKNK